MKNQKKSKKEIAIEIRNISKSFKIPHEKVDTVKGVFVGAFKKRDYEKFKALSDVSFEVRKGEFFGIIGRNGSGKSTLLKILANIYTPDSGKIKVNGKISPFLELGIGFNPELSGRDNVYLNATVLGLTKKQIDEKFNSIVKFSELERFIDQKLKNYSSGMQVRLAFSVSIHANRDILLMDEVLAVGDTNFQNKCLEEFNNYKDLGKTVILVSHDITTIQRYCDRAILLRNGKIEMIGKPENVGNKYIYQNMSDEERRIFDEDKARLEKSKVLAREISKKSLNKQEIKRGRSVKIVKAEFLNGEGRVRNVFRSGDEFKVKVYFKRNISKTKELNVGIGIYSDDGVYVLGYNTQMDSYKISRDANCIALSFGKIPLLKGHYSINIVCFGNIEEKYYDVKVKYKKFIIHPSQKNNKYRGILDAEHTWI